MRFKLSYCFKIYFIIRQLEIAQKVFSEHLYIFFCKTSIFVGRVIVIISAYKLNEGYYKYKLISSKLQLLRGRSIYTNLLPCSSDDILQLIEGNTIFLLPITEVLREEK